MAKQLLYTDDARKKLLAGRREAGPRRRHHARADRPQRHHRQVLRRPDRHQGRRHRLQGNRPARPVREHGRQARQRRRLRRPPTWPATAPPPRPSWPCAIYQEGLRNITSGANPMAVSRGIDKAVEAAVDELHDKLSQAVSKKEEIAQVGTISANNDPTIGKHAGRRLREGRQGRRDHRRGRQDLRDDARVRRGHAVRQGLLSPYFVTSPTTMEVRASRTP